MLTLQQLKDMEPDTVFDTGLTTDDAKGINMTGSGQQLRWIATRGGIHDWAIYTHLAERDSSWIKKFGDKVHNRKTVKKLVPCDDEALGMYRD
jgi:hypothetical protein